jgi:soluble lytic murein transglycosylase-like protein
LHTKLSINSALIKLIAFALSYFLCTQSMAGDMLSSAAGQLNTDVSTSAEFGEAISDMVPDTLSETAAIALETIDHEEVATNTTTIVTETPKPVATSLPTGTAKNPYSQLVSLAFKGKGINGVSNYAEAAAQYCKAARDSNDANAEFALGWMYVNGRGVEKDENVAALFFTKAANQGHESAKNWLASTKGNALQATQPKCLLPEPPTKSARNTYENSSSGVSTSFYTKGPIYKLVSKIAPRFKIDTDLAMAFIAVESGFNPKATSPKNARGLMQLIPETAARFNVKNSYDPEDNIKGGLAYLQWLLTYFEGDVKLVAAAYNSGENTVEKYKGVPPYPETRKYVRKIASLYNKPFHPYSESAKLSKRFTSAKISS